MKINRPEDGLKINIRMAGLSDRFPGTFTVIANDKRYAALGFGELLELIIGIAGRGKMPPFHADDNADFAEVEQPVLLAMPKDEAERLSYGISDIACWISGFKAACPEAYERHPMNSDVLTTLNLKIKSALEIAERKES